MIAVQNVKKKYKDFELDVSLKVPAGKVTGLVGKNGAGKSTTIKMILGLVKPDDGKVTVFDKEMFLSKCRKLQIPMKKVIREFSTGMRAKLRVLVAMTHNAKLLIMDEPTVGLDVEARNEILDMLREYLAEDEERSILITSHISSDLEGLCKEREMHNRTE